MTLINETPCPDCGEPYFLIPVCKKCGWKDEEWIQEHRKKREEMEKYECWFCGTLKDKSSGGTADGV